MNAIDSFVIPDQILLWAANVLIHVTMLTAISLLIALLFRKTAVTRYWILCLGMLLVLGSPLVSALIQVRGDSLLTLALLGEDISTQVTPIPTPTPVANAAPELQRSIVFDPVPRAEESPMLEPVATPLKTALTPPLVNLETTARVRSGSNWLRLVVTSLIAIWAIGTMIFLVRMSIGWIRVARILRQAKPVENAELLHQFKRACAAVGCCRSGGPGFVVSDAVSVPIAAGFFSGTVVLPERLVEQIEPANLADVLVHEIAHVARRDQIVVLVQNLVAALYWPHPLIKRLNRELAKAREEVCDNFVLAATEASTYSRTLLSLAQIIQQADAMPGSVGFFTDRWKLEDRIAGLLDNQRLRTTFLNRRGGIFVAATSAALAVLMCLGTITFATGQIIDNGGVETVANALSYSGRVETPQGEPIAGAKIWLAVTSHEEDSEGLLRELGTADDRGQFEVVLSAETAQEIRKRLHFSQAQLVATAQGRGLDWLPLDVFEDNPASSAKRDTLQARIDQALGEGRFASRALKLPPESQPVRGRLVDLEGHRLPSVAVLVESLWQPDIPRLLKALEKSWKREVNEALSVTRVGGLARSELQKLIPPVTTDENGEFQLRGIGDDQLVTLVFAADRVEARPVSVLGREMETVSLPHISWYPDGAKDVFLGREFTYAVGPSVPVEGIVTDYDTGQPVAGVLVYVERLFKNEGDEHVQLRLDTHHMRTVTDRQGRFRITGMPPGEGHVVEAVPPKSEPYLMTSQDVSLSLEDGEAKRIEIQVKRGIWIEGRVTDKQSGEALLATVDYLPLRDNPNQLLKLGLDPVWVEQRYWTNRDGRYRTLGLPGPGVLLVRSQVPGYPLAAGAETIDGYDASVGAIATTFSPQVSNWHLLKQVDPAADASSFRCDLELDAGGSVPGRVVGPDGKPISELHVLGQNEGERWWRPRHDDKVRMTDRFAVYGYDGKGPRQLFFKNQDETLVGQYRLEGDAPEEIVVTLGPSVRVTGRLIDNETDLAAARYFLSCEKCSLVNEKYPPVEFQIHWCFTDDEGRFEIKGLMAGLAYKMNALNDNNIANNRFTIDLTDAQPGDVIELGDVTGRSSDGDFKN